MRNELFCGRGFGSKTTKDSYDAAVRGAPLLHRAAELSRFLGVIIAGIVESGYAIKMKAVESVVDQKGGRCP